MPLTDVGVKNAKPRDDGKVITFPDGNSVYLWVMGNGAKYWRITYRFGGKQKTLALGVYPDTSLRQAREKRDKTTAKAVIRAGCINRQRYDVHQSSGSSHKGRGNSLRQTDIADKPFYPVCKYSHCGRQKALMWVKQSYRYWTHPVPPDRLFNLTTCYPKLALPRIFTRQQGPGQLQRSHPQPRMGAHQIK